MSRRMIVLLGALTLFGSVAPFDDATARCTGCACRGGPGFRSPAGACVGWKNLVRICGPAPHSKCKDERGLRATPRIGQLLDQTPAAAQFATITPSCLKLSPR